MNAKRVAQWACLTVLFGAILMSSTLADTMEQVTSVEGITEYRLENGLQVLLVPDASKPVVTVNMTIFVGSRHEGYGEAGMAHLLEHMLFKGTPTHDKIPKMLQDRGARFNGTTWLDRTNYYETLPAENDNLEFAIRLEADRLVNSRVAGEDLNSEMSVVRSEFESGEDSPFRVLQQRMFSAAFQWHNYGKSTIGNRSDIERVPIENLKEFYRRHYRPSNTMLVVAGKFDPENALKLIEKYFGILENPTTPINRTYTEEPPQDGEKVTYVRRVGDSQWVGAAYHVPAGGDPEYPAVDALSVILEDEPAGRLYKNLVQTEMATTVTGASFALHDPGVMFFLVEVPKSKSIDEASDAFLNTLEKISETPITEQELARAKNSILKQRELRAGNTTALATELSEWAAQGDWRLYFLYRDRVEALALNDVQQVAERYLRRNNRTLGLFIPTDAPERVKVPSRPNVSDMLANYEGRQALDEGEELDTSPSKIEERTIRGVTETGMQYALLPYKTRGNTLSFALNLRFGNEKAMFGKGTAIEFLGPLMARGTQSMNYEEMQARLDELRANVSVSSQPGLVRIGFSTKREYVPQVMEVVAEMLRSPALSKDEFEILKRESITGIESSLSEPQALAPTAVAVALNQFPRGDVRYSGTLEEQLEDVRKVSYEDVVYVYEQMLGGKNAELVAAGDFDTEMVLESSLNMLTDWTSGVPYERAATPANTSAAGQIIKIETPDKANSLYFAQQQYEMRDDDPQYPALLIGNYILGSGALSSRLGNRVRQEEGLSYGVASMLDAHPVDARSTFMVYAIANPANREKLMATIREEIDKLLKDGITEEELQSAKAGYLQSQQVARTGEARLAGLLSGTIFAQRTMEYYENLESRIASLSVDEVNQALQTLIDPERLVIATAGDFANNPSAEDVEPKD